VPAPYTYFVSYAHTSGFGNVEIFRAEPIRSHADLTEIGEILARKNGEHQPVIVLNFALLSGPDGAA